VTPVALEFLKGRCCGIIVTDQGSRFTSEAFTGVLAGEGIAIGMDGAWTARSGSLQQNPGRSGRGRESVWGISARVSKEDRR